MPIFLETPRLIIKACQPGDLDDMYALQADKIVMQHIGQGSRTLEEVKESLQKSILHHAKHGFSFSSVFEKASNAFVGQAGLMYFDYDDTQPEIEIGYRLKKAFWNKGYATELATALIAWGFANLTVDYIVGVTRPENKISQHILRKVGMRYVERIVYKGSEFERFVVDRI